MLPLLRMPWLEATGHIATGIRIHIFVTGMYLTQVNVHIYIFPSLLKRQCHRLHHTGWLGNSISRYKKTSPRGNGPIEKYPITYNKALFCLVCVCTFITPDDDMSNESRLHDGSKGQPGCRLSGTGNYGVGNFIRYSILVSAF